ncbi:hypothetical protein [Candidatus Rhabdochlamydia sp. T3358]|uniref:hypothetical protein n=1 Tax=Candidatus Rhabdochlamydia sp. T3358 TaxID=2099795 RepID=UPI0010BA04CA|nr:hypothetical protein [Candidatus Rhabdochlamydia sp. T3358]VHO03499.1 hypothetical protein RHT_00950 [Candidatus Rhabdochlamydia sp. T3358]
MCVSTILNPFSWVYCAPSIELSNTYQEGASVQQEIHAVPLEFTSFKPVVGLKEDLEKQLKKNNEHKTWNGFIKPWLDGLKKVHFFSRERLQGKFLFQSKMGEELRLKRGKIFRLEQKSVFIIDEEVFLTQEAKQGLLKAGQDFLLDRGRVFLSQIGEIFIKNKEVLLIEKGKAALVNRGQVFVPRKREIFLSEQGEVFLERQGIIFQLARETFFHPSKNQLFRSNKVKGFISEERAASLEGAVKKMLINFLIRGINLIEENTENDKQIKSLESQLERYRNQNKDQIEEISLKKMIASCKEENDRYQMWIDNTLFAQDFLDAPIFFNPKQLLGKLVRDNSNLKIDKERKIEMIESLEKQLEYLSKAGISPCS